MPTRSSVAIARCGVDRGPPGEAATGDARKRADHALRARSAPTRCGSVCGMKVTLAGALRSGDAEQLAIAEPDRAACRQQPGQRAQQRRLAGAVGPDQRRHAPSRIEAIDSPCRTGGAPSRPTGPRSRARRPSQRRPPAEDQRHEERHADERRDQPDRNASRLARSPCWRSTPATGAARRSGARRQEEAMVLADQHPRHVRPDQADEGDGADEGHRRRRSAG